MGIRERLGCHLRPKLPLGKGKEVQAVGGVGGGLRMEMLRNAGLSEEREKKGWSEGLMRVARDRDDGGQRREGMREQRF